MLHLEKVGAKLTKMSKEQAEYISVKPSGLFKPDTYATKTVANDYKIFRTSKFISQKIADKLSKNDCIFLIGEIGVGKTTFTRYLINYLQEKKGEKITEVLSLLLTYFTSMI